MKHSLESFRQDARALSRAATPKKSIPMSRREMDLLGWDELDVILITGDAYVDHPSFGTSVIARLLQWLGYRVGVVAQPDVSDPKSAGILGKPKLFWGITAGNVDSQLAHLTVMRKRRRDDPYTPGGKAGKRPPNATIVYTSMARHIADNVPVVIGGIEASLRTFAYYDYWTDKVRRSILFDSKADFLVYGMAERAIAELAFCLSEGSAAANIKGTAHIEREPNKDNILLLPSFDNVAENSEAGRLKFSEMTATIHSWRCALPPKIAVQKHDNRYLVVNPPQSPLSTQEMDIVYALPFSRKPHPSYLKQRIPAWEMIKDSVTIHRGCCADCSFCAITAHQGRAISSRSEIGIKDELRQIVNDPNFKGTITDLGGPTANMYGFRCSKGLTGCPHRNCVYPDICENLEIAHDPLIRLMKNAKAITGIKHLFISSGIRFDLALQGGGESYVAELAKHHTGGLLKIAPEHISEKVLAAMRKPGAEAYRRFVELFLKKSREAGKRQAVVEYFMSGHPGCEEKDMVELAVYLRGKGIKPEQVQDFYPAPSTIAASMYYTGMDPLTGKKMYIPRTDTEKARQRSILLGKNSSKRTEKIWSKKKRYK